MVKLAIAITLSFAFLAPAYQPFSWFEITMVQTHLQRPFRTNLRLDSYLIQNRFRLSALYSFNPALRIEDQSLP